MITGRLARGALREERKKSGYTQQQIADLLGVDRSTYAYYESGKLQVPDEVLLKLAAYYDMPVSMFFTESSDSVVFHSDLSVRNMADRMSEDGLTDAADGIPLTFEEKRLLSQLRARSCYTDDPQSLLSGLAPMEIEDDALLDFLVDPDGT